MKSALLKSPHRRASERGSAVLLLLVLLSIMLLLVANNARTAYWLRQELKLVEKRQIERLAADQARPAPGNMTITNQTPTP